MHQLDNGRKILEEIETRNAQFYICAHNVLVCFEWYVVFTL